MWLSIMVKEYTASAAAALRSIIHVNNLVHNLTYAVNRNNTSNIQSIINELHMA